MFAPERSRLVPKMIEYPARERHPRSNFEAMSSIDPPEPTAGSPSRERWLLFGVWLAAAVLGYAYLGRGWIAHDVGTLGHAAERVLAGELPHRDFVDVYTGGQALLNALAFGLFGVQIMTLRMVFFGAYLLWIPTAWVVARAFVGPGLAAASTMFVATLTLPVYAEGMPSWYNLFLATAGSACLLRYLQNRRVAWLVLAGLAGGVSILFKVVGLFYVAAGLLFLMHVEATDGSVGPTESGGERGAPDRDDAHGPARMQGSGTPDGSGGSDAPYRAAVFLACAVMGLLALLVVVTGSDTAGLIHFAVPPLAAVSVVIMRLRNSRGPSSRQRFSSLLRLTVPFVVGVGGPVLLFCLPYLFSGSLAALYEGVFVLPRLRFEFATWDSPPILGFVPAIALVGWVAWTPGRVRTRERVVVLVGAAVLLGLAAMSHADAVYRVIWNTLRSLGPVLAVVGAWALIRMGAAGGGQGRAGSSGPLLLLGVFGFCNLVQIPFAAPIYFLYAAPLLALLAVALVQNGPPARAGRLLFVTVVLVGFSGFRMDAGFLYHLGFRYRAHRQTESLNLERARGIRVTPEEKAEIEQLVQGVLNLDPGPVILAMPDAPEVYFLTGLHNPTTTLFEFFEESSVRTERILSLVDDTGLEVVVLNRRNLFSPPVEGPLLDSLEARFGWSAEAGRFRILWKGPKEDPASIP
jgi:hypothetical protein